MDLVRDLVGLGRASREAAKIKVRQPIQKVLIDGKYEELISDLTPLIKEELNVKEVEFTTDLKEYMNFSLKPNFKVAGPILGSKIKAYGKALASLDASVVVPKLQSGETVTIDLDGEDFEVSEELVMINTDAKEGFNVTIENNLFVILDTTLNQELLNEGFAREFISKIQQMRKNNEYEMMDNIEIKYSGDEDITKAVEEFADYIKSETLALKLESVEATDELETCNLNGHDTGIVLKRV